MSQKIASVARCVVIQAYEMLRSKGSSTSYETYARACRPYRWAGNQCHEAFDEFWARLQVM